MVLAEDRTTARRVEETRRDFVANVSHELKTPIGGDPTVVRGGRGRRRRPPEAVLRFASRMQRESHRLGELVGQIIDLSRLQSDNPLLRAEPVDIDRVLARAVDGSRVKADRRGITLVLAGGERGTTVLGDAQQLGVAVQNLVENAVIYSEPNTRVTVATRRTSDGGGSAGRDQRLRQRDRHPPRPGPATDLRTLLPGRLCPQPRQRRHRARSGHRQAHRCRARGGQVNVWSKVGQGSTFTIQLPYNSGEPVADHEEAGDDGAAADNGGQR